MAKIRIAINGFGRIGRSAFKIASQSKDLEVAAINDLTDSKTLAHLLKYDTAYGIYDKDVRAEPGFLIVDKKPIPVLAEKDPSKLPWKEKNIDVVLECTGFFVKDGSAKQHLVAGAKRVIVSAPTQGTGGIQTYLLGVNDLNYADDSVISNASCTTNCLGPVAQVILDNFGIRKAVMTTIHSYTADQNLQDGPHKDLRRARAAAANIVPTTTGAAVSVTEVVPELKGKFDGLAIRVPTITGSITDFTFLVAKKVTAEQINDMFRSEAGKPRYKGIMAVTEDPLVSSDIVGNPHSAIVDLGLTKVVDGDLVKVMAWYDNEWGYANRLVEQIFVVTK
ncbi:MAG: type I glyceraldehyde-3-phosphate dehydrogenase [Candidatus Doudnabacteria bacterium RIFCSPHIGHO2_01_FULL_46_14]|uniref:Glyceraldehyde-3-phosphate dehydrogenase n=1 Tax=Candidatus Doudnabacteria bacterium RIFCSPHIGHO2_01_FULL_46_14 TaxID=1817824 RepID=A0A1F5NKV1_9BACT|nr:MAG: type I glyceraldehyde-3-phosphate dehydrogenase [Candidatus Doudnabacteria bacterium RIFCSPHIGHO2_01_FULL_46_14]